MEPLLDVKNVTVKRGKAVILDNVSLTLETGKTYGIVGKSGSGKSTLAKVVSGLIPAQQGSVLIEGKEIPVISWSAKELWARRLVQMIFQDPYSCLNPKMTILDILSEPYEVHGLFPNKSERLSAILKLLENVGLPQDIVYRLPTSLSGGQRQRIALARALAVCPRLLILDESLSALDEPLRYQMIDLLKTLQSQYGMSYLFITHHLDLAEEISDVIGVFYKGCLVEEFVPHQPISHAHTHELYQAHAFLDGAFRTENR